MDKQGRREALRQYKETKAPAGVFAVRCTATGEAWVGVSRNLTQQKNPIWFGLKLGTFPNKAMVAAWQAHGADSFTFDVLETLPHDDLSRLAVDLMLKDGHKRWRDRLGAPKVTG